MNLIDVEAEQGLLGALLVDASIITPVRDHHFGDPVHQRIMQAIDRARRDGTQATPHTLRHLLSDDTGLEALGGPKYLARLAGMALTSQAKDLGRIIIDLWSRRAAVEAVEQARSDLTGTEVAADDAFARLDGALAAVRADAGRKSPVRLWADALLSALEEANEAYQAEGHVGVRTGVHDLDQLLGGLRPGNLCVVAGRPSMGKSAVAIAFAVSAARAGLPVIFVTLEMTGEEIGQRFLSMMAAERGVRVPFEALRRGAMEEDQFRTVYDVAQEFAQLPVSLIERDARDLGRLRGAVAQAAKRRKPALIVVDYLQRITISGNMSTYERVTQAVGALKALSAEHAAPVLALSQLSRQVEQRDPPRPELSDLRDSGAIEEDADQAVLVYRPEYYLERRKPDSSEDIDEWHRALEIQRGRVELIVAKNRHGRIGTAATELDVAVNRLGG